jgi:hypothetical protein
MHSHIKYANYGVLVAAIIMIGGAIIFRDAGDTAIRIVTAVGFIAAFVTHDFFERRAHRRRSDDR